jgi:hypothetical protein
MLCPECGAEAFDDQKFCRFCGNRLRSEAKNTIGEWANDIGLTGALILAGIITVFILVNLISNIIGTNWLRDYQGFFATFWQASLSIALIFVTVGIFLKILGWILKPDSAGHPGKRNAQLEENRTNRLVEGKRTVEIASITEHTTEFLGNRRDGPTGGEKIEVRKP